MSPQHPPCGSPPDPSVSSDGPSTLAGLTPAGPQGGLGVLDAQALAYLRSLDPSGEGRLLERVMVAFNASVARLWPQLEAAMQSQELPAVRYVAHTLKSSSASIGAVKLSQMCAEIETIARLGQFDQMADRVALLQSELGVVRDAVQRILST